MYRIGYHMKLQSCVQEASHQNHQVDVKEGIQTNIYAMSRIPKVNIDQAIFKVSMRIQFLLPEVDVENDATRNHEE